MLECPAVPPTGSVYPQPPMIFDPVSGLILRGHQARPSHGEKPDLTGLWICDPTKNLFRKSLSPLPGFAFNHHALVYEPFSRDVLFFLPRGLYRYDRERDAWDVAAAGDFSAYLVAFDPAHNVFLALRRGGHFYGRLCAFRYKNVPAGTEAKLE